MINLSKGATIALCMLSIVCLGSCFTGSTPDARARSRQAAVRSASASAAKDKVACVEGVDVRRAPRRTPSDEMEKVTAQRVSTRGGVDDTRPGELRPCFRFEYVCIRK